MKKRKRSTKLQGRNAADKTHAEKWVGRFLARFAPSHSFESLFFHIQVSKAHSSAALQAKLGGQIWTPKLDIGHEKLELSPIILTNTRHTEEAW